MDKIKFKNIEIIIRFQKVIIRIIKIKRLSSLNRIKNNILSNNRDNKNIES